MALLSVSTPVSSLRKRKLASAESTFLSLALDVLRMVHCRLYDNYGRTYLFDIDYWHINNNGRDESKYTVDAFHAGNVCNLPAF